MNTVALNERARPFLKWAGGKTQLLPEIRRFYPFEQGETTRYAEPFVGSGAVLFDVLSKFELDSAFISDVNPDLVVTYRAIRDDVDGVVKELKRIQGEFLPLETFERKAYYADKRARFNELRFDVASPDEIERAALMIFLNRTCFNGLFRVNKKGMFNVPMGSYKNPLICDERNLFLVSEMLRGVEIACADYQASADFIDDKTFVYFDPPYRPLSSTSNFTAYAAQDFDDEQQKRLARFFADMSGRGAKIVLSNSDPKNTDPDDDFFDVLYASYTISRVRASRMINCRSDSRGKISELLISN